MERSILSYPDCDDQECKKCEVKCVIAGLCIMDAGLCSMKILLFRQKGQGVSNIALLSPKSSVSLSFSFRTISRAEPLEEYGPKSLMSAPMFVRPVETEVSAEAMLQGRLA